MSANSTTFTSRRRTTALAHLARAVRPMTAMLNAVRVRWDHLAQAGQMGPVREREIGRHTGARI